MEFTAEILNKLADSLASVGVFTTKAEFEKRLSEMVDRAHTRADNRKSDFSISRVIRGMSAMRGAVIDGTTQEQDINYTRALTTGSGAGSYLIPTLQASDVLEYLSVNGVARKAGVRIWNFPGVKKISVPISTGLPTAEWLGESTSQSLSDINLGQVNFNAKTLRAITSVPNELLRFSDPAIDQVISELMGIAFAEAEDIAFFKTTSTTNGPSSLYATATTTTLLANGNSANGGNLTYADITAILYKSAAAKARGPFIWWMSSRTFWSRILNLIDTTSRPLIVSDPTAAAPFRLFGAPVFVSPIIPEDQTNGSGTAQSYLVYTNPKYCHIMDDGQLELKISEERYLLENQTAVRGVKYEDFGFGPSAGIAVLRGIN